MMMRRFGLMMLAILGVPLVWVLGRCFLGTLVLDTLDAPFFSASRIAFFAGCLLMTALYAWRGSSFTILYVFAHEMTHALAGLLCFAKIHKINIQRSGGFVQLSKSNLVITLAPYCLPFYLLCGVVLYGLVQYLWPDVLPFPLWSGVFGVLTAFHVLFTFDALLSVSQPDTHEYGRFFSWWFILVTNLFFALLAVTATSPKMNLRQQTAQVAATTRDAYAAVYAGMRGAFHSVGGLCGGKPSSRE